MKLSTAALRATFEKKSASQLLTEMISLLTESLDELSDVSDEVPTQFEYGEKTAYVECLEWLSSWENAKDSGLDFEIEKRFPL